MRFSGGSFETVWLDLTLRGDVAFGANNADGVFECKAPVPPGSFGPGYFNLHGDSPIGGHLRAENGRSISFVDRPFLGRRSCSVQLVNEDGAVVFKAFVGSNPDRTLRDDQVLRFETLRARL